MRRKTADIPDTEILQLLAVHQGQWAFLHNEGKLSWHSPTIYPFDKPYEFKDLASPKLVRSKFKSLIRRRLVGGCGCGCRGDFEITDKGLESIGATRYKRYSGY